jgi:arginyl-tRNA synthetase
MLEQIIKDKIKEAFEHLYGSVDEKQITVQKTRKDVKGDYTINVFPFLRVSKAKPEETAEAVGIYLKENLEEISEYNVIKGFLNIEINQNIWLDYFKNQFNNKHFGLTKSEANTPVTMIEYSSPNTNKPLHLGHIRNNLLGFSVAELLKANGNNVVKVNLVNDRGIHICKSMLAWQKWGDNATPESANLKGDKLVGEYYVRFDKEYKKEIEQLVANGKTKEEAEKQAPLLAEAQDMLRKWEAKDSEVYALWQKMNGWVYDGFDVTYKALGIDFDKIYYESNTYLLGKKIVAEGLKKGILYKQEDGSIWADLTDDGLDQKLLQRADGTSVYMTQDIGTAQQRFEEYNIDKHLYVVGNEQNYHFQVLKIVLAKLGYDWAENIEHLSYGMVELPEGKMKSREGTVVDADDLIQEMIDTARETSEELGKLDGYSNEEKEDVYKTIALGALKYYMLKVDPKKGMMFNPKESIDFNGNTGPFIQYTYARIRSLITKWDKDIRINIDANQLSEKETDIIIKLFNFKELIADASKQYSPSMVASYIYELAKEFNQFYHDYSILKEEDENIKMMRLALSSWVGITIKNGMKILGIKVPERM